MFDRIPDITAQRALLKPDAVAFRDLVRGTTLTYRELEGRVRSLAGLLRAAGVGEGDRIAVICRNRIEFFELLFAAGKLGAVLVPLNWRMPAAELAPLVDDAAPRFLFYGAEDAAVARELGDGDTRRIGLDDESAAGYAAARDSAQPFAGREFWNGNDTWYLIYTSGTTGKPKAVIQTPAMAFANYVNIRQAMAISGDDVCLNYLPLFHTAGINLVTLPTLIEGGEVLVMPGFDVDAVVRLLAAGALDTFFAVPAVYQQISLHPEFPTLDLSRVRNWGCGGAPMPDLLIQAYLERGARVCNGMGMTETGPTVFIMDPATVDRKIGSVGKPQVLARVRLVGPDGKDVQQGEEGELWFAGPGVTPGYWGNPEATRATFEQGAWLRSGDIGRQDSDGYYYIAGRIKEMFISGGENVYPAEVENALAAHPDILEAAVIAVPDEKWGEVGRAYILAQPGHDIPAADNIMDYCRERLAPYKVPKEFVSVQDFPRTAAGKIQKHLLATGQREMSGRPDTLVLEKVLTQADFDAFAELSGDDNPIHVDREFSANTRFGGTVAHGMLLGTVLRGMLDRLVPGGRQVEQKLMFPSPTYAGEALRFAVILKADDGRHVVAELNCERIEDGVITCAGETTLRRPEHE